MEMNRVQDNDENMREDIQEAERWNCKGKSEDKEDHLIPRRPPMELVLRILGARNIDVGDDVAAEEEGSVKWFCAVYWVEPDKVSRTRVVYTDRSSPGWEDVDYIPVVDHVPGNYGFLHVEVARLCSDSEPGTSSGTVIVGRVRVPLPRVPNFTIEDRFELVRPIGDGNVCIQGDILLRMTLRVPRSAHLQQQQQDQMIYYHY